MKLKHYFLGTLLWIFGCLVGFFVLPSLINSSTPKPEPPPQGNQQNPPTASQNVSNNPEKVIGEADNTEKEEVVSATEGEENTKIEAAIETEGHQNLPGDPVAQVRQDTEEIPLEEIPPVDEPVADMLAGSPPPADLLGMSGKLIRQAVDELSIGCAWHPWNSFPSAGAIGLPWYQSDENPKVHYSLKNFLEFYGSQNDLPPIPAEFSATPPYRLKEPKDIPSIPRPIADFFLRTTQEQSVFLHHQLREKKDLLIADPQNLSAKYAFDTMLHSREGFALLGAYTSLFGLGLEPQQSPVSLLEVFKRFPQTPASPESSSEEASRQQFLAATQATLTQAPGPENIRKAQLDAWNAALERLSAPPETTEPIKAEPVVTENVSLDELLNYPGFAEKAGKRIWQSECAGTKAGLTSWNSGEGFASLGIGHFLWYPSGKEFEFEESFPDLLKFYQANHSRLPRPIPQWLLETEDCPWSTKSEFEKAANDARMVQLRDYLYETVPLQTEFIYERLKASRAKLLENTDPENRARVGQVFDTLLKTPPGFFAMLDYVNFKGEGTSPKERYNDEGWGLLQVLERMPEDISPENAHKAFSTAATATLTRRTQNNPKDKKWLNGWTNRTSAYANDF